MPSATIGALRVDLGLNTAQFGAGLKRASKQWSMFGVTMRSGVLAAVSAATAVATGVTLAVRGTINAADEMQKASQKFGVPIEDLSRLRYAAEQADVGFEALGAGLKRLSVNMAKAAADPTSDLAAVFSGVGVAVTDAAGQLRPVDDVLSDIAEAMAAMPDGAAKIKLATDLGGKSFNELIPLLNQGKAALEAAKAEADTFGQVFTAEMGQQADTFNDNIDRLKGTFANMAADMTERLLPVLSQFSTWLVENGPRLASNLAAVIEFVAGLARAAGAFSDFMHAAVAQFQEFTSAITSVFTELPGQLRQVGADAIQGLVDGFWQRWETLKSRITAIPTAIADSFRSIWREQSPSKVFHEIGANAMLGLEGGISSMQGNVQSGVESFAQGLSNTFANILIEGGSFRDALQNLLAQSLGQAGGGMLTQGIGGIFSMLKIPGFARGTNFAPGGLALVGERGPELVNLPRGARVAPNDNLGSSSFTFAPVIDARGADSAAVARAMAEQRAQFEAFRSTFRDRSIAAVSDPRYRGR